MTSKPFIILGEARESDSEEEIDFSTTGQCTDYTIQQCTGKIVRGEAPESDDECRDSKNQSIAHKNVFPSEAATTLRRPSHKHPSILVKKLYEKNISLRNNLLEFTNQLSSSSESELNNTNQRLLRCQVQMQQGVEFLKIINSNLSLLDSRFQSFLSINYLPKIKLN